MIRWPKPTSGASPESAWLNLFVEACKSREVRSIEGYDDQESLNGRVFKKKYAVQPSLTSSEYFHPFKIYHPSNFPSTGLIFDSDGNASTCAIDSSVPTNLPVTLNPNTDSWRIFAVRNGVVETRSFTTITDPENAPSEFVCDNSTLIDMAAIYDFDYISFGNFGTDGVSPLSVLPNGFSNSLPYDEQTTTINVYEDFSGENGGQVLIYGGALNPGTGGTFCIWLDLFEITVRAIDDVNMDALNTESPLVVPVGMVFFNATQNVIQQFLFGHAINRFPQGMYSPGALPTSIANIKSGALNLRGSWTADNLSDQVFYDGDYVIDDSTVDETYYVAATSMGAVTTEVQLYGVYAYTGGVNMVSSSPATDTTDWVKIGTIKL